MKTLFAFFAILGIAGGILAFCFFSPVIAAFALFLYLLVGGGFVFSFAYNHGLRKKWLADPILPSVIIFIFFQKYLVEGISTSGLKG